jgi:hypothetical protein
MFGKIDSFIAYKTIDPRLLEIVLCSTDNMTKGWGLNLMMFQNVVSRNPNINIVAGVGWNESAQRFFYQNGFSIQWNPSIKNKLISLDKATPMIMAAHNSPYKFGGLLKLDVHAINHKINGFNLIE